MNKQELVELQYAMCIRYLEGLIFGNPNNDASVRASCSNVINNMENIIISIKEEPVKEVDE